MTIQDVYKELVKLQKVMFQSDDCMDQDTLWELQERLANLTLKVANSTGQTDDLVKKFPYLYKREV